MFGRLIFPDLVSGALNDFLVQLPALRDGAEDAIHQARVAIRRVREAEALLGGELDAGHNVGDSLRRVFKALGRARDADIAQGLVQHVETHFAMTPATTGQLRASIARTQLSSRRRLIKRLEALDLDALRDGLRYLNWASPRVWRHAADCRTRSRTHMADRVTALQAAVEHGSGVYFPNRAHSLRVAVKQLRYAIELAEAAGLRHAEKPLKTLRKAQNALGQAHDREVLLTRLHSLGDEGVPVNDQEVNALDHFLRGEIRAQHERYLEVRPDLLLICAAYEEANRPHRLRLASVAAASITVPAVLLLRRANGR